MIHHRKQVSDSCRRHTRDILEKRDDENVFRDFYNGTYRSMAERILGLDRIAIERLLSQEQEEEKDDDNARNRGGAKQEEHEKCVVPEGVAAAATPSFLPTSSSASLSPSPPILEHDRPPRLTACSRNGTNSPFIASSSALFQSTIPWISASCPMSSTSLLSFHHHHPPLSRSHSADAWILRDKAIAERQRTLLHERMGSYLSTACLNRIVATMPRKKLGEGSYGKVWLGRLWDKKSRMTSLYDESCSNDEDGERKHDVVTSASGSSAPSFVTAESRDRHHDQVAVKEMLCEKHFDIAVHEAAAQMTMNEVVFGRMCPNFVLLYDMFVYDRNRVLLFEEHINGGIMDVTDASDPCVVAAHCFQVFVAILSMLLMDILHQDIRKSNILLLNSGTAVASRDAAAADPVMTQSEPSSSSRYVSARHHHPSPPQQQSPTPKNLVYKLGKYHRKYNVLTHGSIVCIADFGISRRLSSIQTTKCNTKDYDDDDDTSDDDDDDGDVRARRPARQTTTRAAVAAGTSQTNRDAIQDANLIRTRPMGFEVTAKKRGFVFDWNVPFRYVDSTVHNHICKFKDVPEVSRDFIMFLGSFATQTKWMAAAQMVAQRRAKGGRFSTVQDAFEFVHIVFQDQFLRANNVDPAKVFVPPPPPPPENEEDHDIDHRGGGGRDSARRRHGCRQQHHHRRHSSRQQQHERSEDATGAASTLRSTARADTAACAVADAKTPETGKVSQAASSSDSELLLSGSKTILRQRGHVTDVVTSSLASTRQETMTSSSSSSSSRHLLIPETSSSYSSPHFCSVANVGAAGAGLGAGADLATTLLSSGALSSSRPQRQQTVENTVTTEHAIENGVSAAKEQQHEQVQGGDRHYFDDNHDEGEKEERKTREWYFHICEENARECRKRIEKHKFDAYFNNIKTLHLKCRY